MLDTRPEALPKATLVEVLRRSGSRTASLEALEADIAAGAPVNADGTLSIVRYAAWVLKEGADAGQH